MFYTLRPVAAAPAILVASISAVAFRVAPADIAAKTRRTARCVRARQAAMYLSHVGFGLDYSAVGRAFGRDPSTVRYACARVETRRDAVRTDRMFDHLECSSRRFSEFLADLRSSQRTEA